MTGGLKTKFLSLLLAVAATIGPASAQAQFENQSDIGRELRIPVHHWIDKSQPTKAIIVAVPGLVFNGRAYQLVSNELVEKGYEVYSADFRGYGDWESAKPGEFDGDNAMHWQKSLEDLTNLLKRLKAAHPDKPIYCMGESFGANLATMQAAEQPNLVDGVIAVSLTYKMFLHPHPRWLRTAAQVMMHPRSPFDLMPYLTPTLSENKSVTAGVMGDENISIKKMSITNLIKARLTMMRAMRQVGEIRKDCPVLVVAGKEDAIQKTSALPKIVKAMGSKQAELVVFEDKGHLLLERKTLEPKALDAVESWLASHTEQYEASRLENASRDIASEPVKQPTTADSAVAGGERDIVAGTPTDEDGHKAAARISDSPAIANATVVNPRQ